MTSKENLIPGHTLPMTIVKIIGHCSIMGRSSIGGVCSLHVGLIPPPKFRPALGLEIREVIGYSSKWCTCAILIFVIVGEGSCVSPFQMRRFRWPKSGRQWRSQFMMDTSWAIGHRRSTAIPSLSILSQFSPLLHHFKHNWSLILWIQVDLLLFFLNIWVRYSMYYGSVLYSVWVFLLV